MAGLIKITSIVHYQTEQQQRGRDVGLGREGSDESKVKRTILARCEV